MEYQYLSLEEQNILSNLVASGSITTKDLPMWTWVGLDSMGPVRDAKTDDLFPGMSLKLYDFTQTMSDYNLGLVVATNGPAKEAHDILDSLNKKFESRAFGVAEGGSLIVRFTDGTLEHRIISPKKEIRGLHRLEEAVKQGDALMKALLENEVANDGEAPMRTPYKTNIVITLPNQYTTLQKRLEAKGIHIEEFIPGIGADNYIGGLLEYAGKIFSTKTQELGLTEKIGSPIIKASNKRVYVPTQHIYDPEDGSFIGLSKHNGVVIGSKLAYDKFYLGNAIYVADNAVDSTRGEHAVVLGASERSMIKNGRSQARMAFNVTMNNAALPTMEHVEGVKILNIGSGLKALEAIDFLYRHLHSYRQT